MPPPADIEFESFEFRGILGREKDDKCWYTPRPEVGGITFQPKLGLVNHIIGRQDISPQFLLIGVGIHID